MNNLKFRRQFLFAPVACEQLEHWQTEKVKDHFLYVHPDCPCEKSSGFFDLYLIGYFIDPHHPTRTSREILTNFSQLQDIDDFPMQLYPLVGRFVLIVATPDDFIFFNDACGLRMLTYTKTDDGFYAASQPLLINEVLQIRKSPAHENYFHSEYVTRNIEHCLPSGVTLYEQVHHLVPNHYVSASDVIQKRYFPSQLLKQRDYPASISAFAALLKKTVVAANSHMDLSFSLTAGWDSRMVLSCCKDIARDVTFYTLRYRNMDDEHRDIRIPSLLSRSLGLDLSIFDCEEDISAGFAEVYAQNTPMAHINDWGKIAFGLSKTFPQHKVAVKGNCSEIGRCFYLSEGKRGDGVKDFLHLEKGWEQFDFVREAIAKWRDELKALNLNYSLYDLFYWEQRMGSWQAQSQLEWDIVQEVFTPFNSRELLDLMLSIEPSKRRRTNPSLYVDAMKYLWPEVLSQPVNPPPPNGKLKSLVVDVAGKMGILTKLKGVVERLH